MIANSASVHQWLAGLGCYTARMLPNVQQKTCCLIRLSKSLSLGLPTTAIFCHHHFNLATLKTLYNCKNMSPVILRILEGCGFVSTCKKSGYFTNSFWRYCWLKNPAIRLTENILAYISGTKIFPNIEFVQEHSKQYKFSL